MIMQTLCNIILYALLFCHFRSDTAKVTGCDQDHILYYPADEYQRYKYIEMPWTYLNRLKPAAAYFTHDKRCGIQPQQVQGIEYRRVIAEALKRPAVKYIPYSRGPTAPGAVQTGKGSQKARPHQIGRQADIQKRDQYHQNNKIEGGR